VVQTSNLEELKVVDALATQGLGIIRVELKAQKFIANG
jgi:hypothetical protein